jgi:peptide chain release factor 1
MKTAIENKLKSWVKRCRELEEQLDKPAIVSDQQRFRDISKEYAQLQPIAEAYDQLLKLRQDEQSTQTMVTQEDDCEMQQMAQQELEQLQAKRHRLENDIQLMMLPEDPYENANVYLEIRAGTGGAEAALFAGDLLRMYSRFAEHKGWQMQLWNATEGEHGGYKEMIVKVSGKHVYAALKFESGTHRVQRVPDTESQGRIHTSACTVAVLPVPQKVQQVAIDANEVRVDTFRAQGAGGQHVNTTDSAVRITHFPTGLVVECQDERSQTKNRTKAWSLLEAKLLEQKIQEQKRQQQEQRRSLVGTGDRSQRIRTYNFPQGRVTDHRVNLTLYQLEQVMNGDLDAIVDKLHQEHQIEQLAELDDE